MTDIALIGEAYGEAEERERRPFVGATGWKLNQLLDKAGIRRVDCFVTNVFNVKPWSNKIESLCGPKAQGIEGYPALVKGGWIDSRYTSELERLANELEEVNPNLTVAFGNTACWALLGQTSIGKLRGTVHMSTHTLSGLKVLPTYHPAAIFRQQSIEPIITIDLMKAKRQSEFPEIRMPQRSIWIEPTLEDIHEFDREHIQPCSLLAVDIETIGDIITCIGFAPSESLAIVIPFVDFRRTSRAYWSDRSTEGQVWRLVRAILGRPTPKVFQNGLYDIAFLWRRYGIRTYGAAHDTMLLHHALQPESLKSLGFLGSLYTDEGPWKQMRKNVQTVKAED